MAALTSLTGADFVAAVIAPFVPEPGQIVIGAGRRGDPRREISIEGQGGREEERIWGQFTPIYITDRVRLTVRAQDRRADTDWMTSLAGLLRSVLLDQRPSRDEDASVVVDETIYLSPIQPIPVRSVYREVRCFQSGGPRTRAYGTGRQGGGYRAIETEIGVEFRPTRERPLTSELGPWSTDRLPVYLAGDPPTPPRLVARATTIPPSGAPGRVVLGGRVEFGAVVPRLLPADDRSPPSVGAGSVRHGTPLTGRVDGLLWVNANVNADSSGGVVDLWTQSSGNLLTDTLGVGGGPVRITGAKVLTGPDRLRIETSANFADPSNLAFLWQDRAAPPNRYAFRLAEAVVNTNPGDWSYTVPVTWATPPTKDDSGDWALADLSAFRLAPAMSQPPPNPRWELSWGARWFIDGVDEADQAPPFEEQVLTAGAGEKAEIKPPADEATGEIGVLRPAGGTLQQLVQVRHLSPQIQRGQEYAVLLSAVRGFVIHGYTPPEPAPPPAEGHGLTEGFTEGFEA